MTPVQVQFPATLEKISTLKDRSFRLTFESLALNDEDGGKLLAYRAASGWLTFAPTSEAVVVPDIPVDKDEKASPAKRAKAVVFVLWDKVYNKMGDFDTFYRRRIERFIDSIKDEIEMAKSKNAPD